MTTKHAIKVVTKIVPAEHPFYAEGTKVKVCETCGTVVIAKLAKHAHGYTHIPGVTVA